MARRLTGAASMIRRALDGLYLAAGYVAGLGPVFYVGLALYALHFVWQVRRLQPDDPKLSLRLFKSNRDAGLILLAAIAFNGLAF